MINKFADKYYFLSNFYEKSIFIKNKEYKSIEHAYQAFKSTNKSEHEWIRNAPNPSKAKYFGKKIKLRKDWNEIKYDLMLRLIKIKFKDEELKKMLLDTGNEELIEGNYWHDNVWGDCKCEKCKDIYGTNWLGKILMKVREEIKNEIELFN